MEAKTSFFPFRNIPLKRVDISDWAPNGLIAGYRPQFNDFVTKHHYDLTPEFGFGFSFRGSASRFYPEFMLDGFVKEVAALEKEYLYYDLHIEYGVIKEPWIHRPSHHYWVVFTKRPIPYPV